MNFKFLNEPSDVQWLKETHLKGREGVPPFRSFVLFGNEDAPQVLHLFSSQDPNYNDPYCRVALQEQ